MSSKFTIALAIASFTDEFENSVRQTNTSRMSGSDSDLGLKPRVT
ncbi:MAG TPA: hypothetical protein VF172_06360 [Nitrososphaera sp.]